MSNRRPQRKTGPHRKHGAGVYYMLNTINNRMYIGQSVRIWRRMDMHLGYLLCGTHDNASLQRDWNQFGQQAFEFGVLAMVDEGKHGLLERERTYQYIYQSKHPAYGYNYNPGRSKQPLVSE